MVIPLVKEIKIGARLIPGGHKRTKNRVELIRKDHSKIKVEEPVGKRLIR